MAAPWYQHAPFPAIVGVLLDDGLLAEGGTASLKLAARVASSSTVDVGDRHTAIRQALARELPFIDADAVGTAQAARDVLDVLIDHEGSA